MGLIMVIVDFAGVFRLRSFDMISAESVDGLFCHTILWEISKQNLIFNCLRESAWAPVFAYKNARRLRIYEIIKNK